MAVFASSFIALMLLPVNFTCWAFALFIAQQLHVTLQVMPFGTVTHPGLEGVLGIIEFPDKTPVWYTDSWSAGTFSDDPAQVTRYLKYFDVIRSSALSPAESLDFFARIRRERYEHE